MILHFVKFISAKIFTIRFKTFPNNTYLLNVFTFSNKKFFNLVESLPV